MIIIDGVILQTTVQDIIEELKFQLFVNGTRLFGHIKDGGDNIMVSCPIHKDGQEKKPSCGIHKQSGVVHCFTCGYSVTMSEMISNVFGYNDYGVFGKSWLKKNFTEVAVEERKDIDIDLSRKELKREYYSYVPESVLDQYRYIHPYMYKRGLNDDTIITYDIGYDKETDCITFPVRDRYGNCLFVARRSVHEKYFNYPVGQQKPLYGIYEMENSTSSVFVCESIFNALSLHQIGYEALALNGTGSKDQIELLRRLPVRSIVLCLDNDDAGIKGMSKIANAIRNDKLLYTVTYKDKRDINDLLLDNELEDLLKTTHLYFG